MINQILLICSIIIIYEFIKFVNLINIIYSSLKIYKKILKLFKTNKASDFRKEMLILNYSKHLFTHSVKIFAILIIISFLVIIFNFISKTFINFIASFYGIIELCLIFSLYHLIRKNHAKI